MGFMRGSLHLLNIYEVKVAYGKQNKNLAFFVLTNILLDISEGTTRKCFLHHNHCTNKLTLKNCKVACWFDKNFAWAKDHS